MTAMDTTSRPLAFCNCASRSPADSPAGPAPTISTSTSRVSRVIRIHSRYADHASSVGAQRPVPLPLLQFSNQRRGDFEDVALDPVIGNLENGCLRVLVDRDDGPRAFHSDEVLNR